MQFPENQQLPQLSRPPIVEGLIDLRIRPNIPISKEIWDKLEAELKGAYPIRKSIRKIQASIKIDSEAGQTVSSSEDLIGFRYESESVPFVLQARVDGFSVSRLAPYTNWAELLAETQRFWSIYSSFIGDSTIIRIATRYINKLQLPGPALDYDNYLTSGPKIPTGLPQTVIEFLMRNVVPFEDQKAILILTQASEPPTAGSSTYPVILDLDVFHEGAYDSREKQFWGILETLRTLKNKAFYAAITENTLELIR